MGVATVELGSTGERCLGQVPEASGAFALAERDAHESRLSRSEEAFGFAAMMAECGVQDSEVPNLLSVPFDVLATVPESMQAVLDRVLPGSEPNDTAPVPVAAFQSAI
jgi:hypothetical protein